MQITGRLLAIASVGFLLLAYSNFGPNALTNPEITPYLKNHLIREFTFGISLTLMTIYLLVGPITRIRWKTIAFLGTIVVSPFWIAASFGFVTQGMHGAWQGESTTDTTALTLHGAQVVGFYVGLVLLYFTVKEPTRL